MHHLKLFGGIFDPDNSKKLLSELNSKVEDPSLWNDRESAQKLMRDRTLLEEKLNSYENLKYEFEETLEILKLSQEENDISLISESTLKLEELYKNLQNKQLETLLSGDMDKNDCFLEINAGAGGTESQDWVQMLLRMYSRWAETKKYKIKIIEEHKGEEAGIKSISICITGINAYGWLKSESGVHRLVRISPFDSQNRRHTSFASVWVYPVIEENIKIDIDEKDIRIDTYRASGAGGQHVNRTDSAVRITYLPENIVVQCQSHRSQHQNKTEAYNMLRAKLYEFELQKKELEKSESESLKTDIGWGNQIRSYVLQPYQMIKDLRTGVESSNCQSVLDGDLDLFIEAALAHSSNKTN